MKINGQSTQNVITIIIIIYYNEGLFPYKV